MVYEFIWTSDIVLAYLFPLVILYLGSRLSLSLTWKELRELLSLHSKTIKDDQFSLNRAYQSYTRYAQLSAHERSRMQASYSTLGRKHKRLGYNIGYTKKLDRLKEVTAVNSEITNCISELARSEFKLGRGAVAEVGSGDLARVRESLKHFVRDWSEQGAEERGKIFAPILDMLRQVDPDDRTNKKVLVPGSGLGRLAWEISELGFDTTANELSFFMNLAFRFLLSSSTTTAPHQHTVHPYANWFSHQRLNSLQFRGIMFPDVVPRLKPNLHLAEQDFLTISVPRPLPNTSSNNAFWSSESQSREYTLTGYDYIVTLFFIDTSLNVFATIEHIYALLRPGGTWINLGPLLWNGGAQSKVELSLEEVLRAAEEIGFIVVEASDVSGGDQDQMEAEEQGDTRTSTRTIECDYTGDPSAMIRWTYKAEFWVARKSK